MGVSPSSGGGVVSSVGGVLGDAGGVVSPPVGSVVVVGGAVGVGVGVGSLGTGGGPLVVGTPAPASLGSDTAVPFGVPARPARTEVGVLTTLPVLPGRPTGVSVTGVRTVGVAPSATGTRPDGTVGDPPGPSTRSSTAAPTTTTPPAATNGFAAPAST